MQSLSKFTNSPIIIGGCGRSGTTLLAAILSSHPNVYSYTYETMAFCPNAWMDPLNRSVPFDLSILENSLIDAPPLDEHDRFLEKTPRNTMVYRRIADYFDGQVKIINFVRDGRDVVLSKYPGKENVQYVTADFWKTEIEYGIECEDFPWFKTFRYEDLVLKFDETLRSICEFCEIEYCEELINYTDFTKYKESDAWSHRKIQNPHQKSIGRWKNQMDHVEVKRLNSEPSSIDLLKKYNYEIISDCSSI